MVASIVMSAFYPTSSGKTPLSKTSNKAKGTPCQSTPSNPKSTNKALSNATCHAVRVPEPNKADLRTLYHAQPESALLEPKKRRPDIYADVFGFGKMVQDGLVFNQNFIIRSYEVGADQKTSIETLMNHLQESALNHGRLIGLQNDGFGSTPEMTKRDLIWVFSKIQLLVDRYPSWGDIVEVDTWLAPQGKNGTRRDWHVRDYYSGQTILHATSLLVIMNKLTRKLAKIPDAVRKELQPYLVDRMPIINEDEDEHCKRSLSNPEKLSDGNNAEKHLIKGLTPKWGDLDLNQHVNNVKYIGWILESAPMEILEKQELAGMTLEYRRECRRDDAVQSVTTVYSDCADSARPKSTPSIHCDHLLSLESGTTIVKARTAWRPKRASRLL